MTSNRSFERTADPALQLSPCAARRPSEQGDATVNREQRVFLAYWVITLPIAVVLLPRTGSSQWTGPSRAILEPLPGVFRLVGRSYQPDAVGTFMLVLAFTVSTLFLVAIFWGKGQPPVGSRTVKARIAFTASFAVAAAFFLLLTMVDPIGPDGRVGRMAVVHFLASSKLGVSFGLSFLYGFLPLLSLVALQVALRKS